MDSPEGLILWILAGAGVTLLYAAFKGKSPLAVITNHVTGNPGSATVPNPPASSGTVAGPASYDSHGVPYSVGVDSTGTQYVYDRNGSPISVLPANYSNTPSTFIPVEGSYDV